MKNTAILAISMCSIIFSYAQNPLWTLTPNYLDAVNSFPVPLPSSPYDPNTGQPNSTSAYSYQGAATDAATNLHAGYTDPWGDLMFFTVDQNLYDYKGWLVGSFKRFYSTPTSGNYLKRGHSERLILPLGNSCTKFAIIYPAGRDHSGGPSSNEDFNSTTQPTRLRLYMSIYDTEAANPFNAEAKGSLIGMNSNNDANTLEDISERDYINWGLDVLNQSGNTTYLYGYKLFPGMTFPGEQGFGVQMLFIAASDYIEAGTNEDDCFYYVFVFEGRNVIRYRLTSTDLEWDGIVYTDPNLEPGSYVRSEMELIQLPSGGYRLAFPAMAPAGGGLPLMIRIIDLDAQGNYVANSAQTIALPGTFPDRAEPHGLEFNSTGRYLYFTHKSHPSLPNALDVWDTQTQSLVTSLPTLSNINNFRESFLERYDEAIVLASATTLGVFQNPGNPTNPGWQPAAIALNVTMQELASNTDATKHRRILPDQIDDGDYTRMLNRTCPCCEEAAAYQSENFEAYYTETWTPTFNPFGNSADVYIDTELRIASNSYITIEDMNFYFGPDARVIVERGFTSSENGGVLHLKNTLFTADHRCVDRNFLGDACEFIPPVPPSGESASEGEGISSEVLLPCSKDYWQGVIVEGFNNLGQPSGVFANSRQGRFAMEQNSTIQFARQAVHIGNPDAPNFGGGILFALNSTVKDCINGFRFDPYIRIQNNAETFNRSVITRANFITTNDFIIAPGSLSPGRCIDVDGSSGVEIKETLFHNQNTSANWLPNQKGVGVYATNSRLRVAALNSPSQFISLAKGIDVVYINNSRQIEILDCVFDNNVVGAQLNGSLKPAVLRNSFRVPRAANNIGLFMDESTGYKVEDNDFRSVSGTLVLWNMGIAVWRSGTAPNQIFNNWFDDITVGIVSAFVNADQDDLYRTGLVYKCNYFERFTIARADILIDNGSISVEQGSCDPNDPSLLPRNSFSHSSVLNASHFDFRVNSTVTPGAFPIQYTTTPQGGLWPYFYPLKVSEIATGAPANYVERYLCSNVYTSEFACDYSRIPATGGEGSFEFSAMSGSDETDNLFEQAAYLENEVFAAAQEIDGGQTLELINLLFTEGNDESVLAQISNIPEGEMSSMLFDAIQKSSYADLIAESFSSMAAVEMLGGSIEVSTAELAWKQAQRNRDIFWQDFAHLTSADTIGAYTPEMFMSIANIHQPKAVQRYVAALANTHGYGIPAWVDDNSRGDVVYDPDGTLAQFAGAEALPAVMLSGEMAEFSEWTGNIAALHSLYAAQRTMYFPVFEIPEDFTPDQGEKSNEQESLTGETRLIHLYPNPFSDELTLKVDKAEVPFEVLRIELFDLLGRRVKSEQFGPGSIFTIDGLHLPKGMLTYTIFLDGTPVQNGKVVRVQ